MLSCTAACCRVITGVNFKICDVCAQHQPIQPSSDEHLPTYWIRTPNLDEARSLSSVQWRLEQSPTVSRYAPSPIVLHFVERWRLIFTNSIFFWILLAICRRGCTVVSSVVGVVVVVVDVCNRSQMRTGKCTCLIFGVNRPIAIDTG